MAARPHQQIITYDEPADTGHYGRNGVMQAHGIIVEAWANQAHLVGLVSRSRRSGAARLAVPFDALPQLIAALQAVADGQ